jgi:leukotriene-A4 hydrolase
METSNSLLLDPSLKMSKRMDIHSFSNPEQIRVSHLKLDLTVSLEQEQLSGTATLRVQRQNGCPQNCPLVLDTRNLEILHVWTRTRFGRKRLTNFELGPTDAIHGAPLVVQMPRDARHVIVEYKTTKGADALQWLPARPGRNKFLFTQGEAILTRTWIPLQDSPGVRITYEAKIHVPDGVKAVMSASHKFSVAKNVFRFKMPYCIPSYLLALAVGDLAYRELGGRTGVYADPDLIDSAAWEFAQAEEMMTAMEKRYGPYRWGRWDILVLPASFPFGGMENPLLTFVTPTLLAGDRSLVAVLIHELAHSWSGNLVTNATWPDFYLNEGFTTYIERRILEDLFGAERAQMEIVIAVEELLDLMKSLKPADQILHINLDGRDPDEGCNRVPYEKGSMFLRTLESVFGRERLDHFVRGYFDHFAFQSITTNQFESYLQEHLLALDSKAAAQVNVFEWLHKPGLPANHAQSSSPRLTIVEAQAKAFVEGQIQPQAIPAKDWTTHEWLRFLRTVSAVSETSGPALSAKEMASLDANFHFTAAGNTEILQQWLLMSIATDYQPAADRLKSFLCSVGRRKYITPLFKELLKAPNGEQRAQELFRQSRATYHPLLISSVEKILKRQEVWE